MKKKLSNKLLEEEISRIVNLIKVDTINEQLVPMGTLSGAGIFNLGTGFKTLEWFESFDKHDWASFIEITTGILGLIPSPASPFLLGISLAAGLTDSMIYFSDGDPYMGGLLLAFSILPLGELIKIIPGAKKWISKNGTKGVINLLKKAKILKNSKKSLNDVEKQIVKEVDVFIEEVSKNADELAAVTAKSVVNKTFSEIIKLGGKKLLGTALLLSKFLLKFGYSISKLGVLVSGIYYTYDEIYLVLYGTDEEKMKIRYNSRFQELIRSLKILSNLQSVEDQATDFILNKKEIFENNPNSLVYIDTVEQKAAIEESKKSLLDYIETRKKTETVSPSFQDILSKKINPYTDSPYVMKKGQKGESVGKLQKLLIKFDLEDTLKGYKSDTKAIDNIFGDNTLDAVLLFQSENGLNETGEVDSTTLNKLLSKKKIK